MKSTSDELNAIYLAAIELWSLNLNVFPLREIDVADEMQYKRPMIQWAPYQQKRTTPDELYEWFNAHPQRGVAIVTGRISGVIAVDVDDADLRDWLKKYLPESPVRTDTRKGEHWLYRYPTELGDRELGIRNKVQIEIDGERRAVDLRADGGYIVGPGTRHPDGVYSMIGQPWQQTWDAMPVMPMEFLDRICRANKSAPVVSAVAVAQPVTRTIEQARRYLQAIPGAVQGQGGDTHTFTTVCKMVRGFALSDSEAYSLLSEWNQRCSPPWTAEELQGKIAGARRYGTEQTGGRVRETSLRLVTGVGNAVSAPNKDIAANVTELLNESQFRIISEGHYELSYPALGIAFDVNRLRRNKWDALCGELTVTCLMPGAYTDDGILSAADFNFSSASERDQHARRLERGSKFDAKYWAVMLERLCRRVITAEREGEPGQWLADVAPSKPDEQYEIDGLPLLRQHPTMLFGDGGVMKSYIGLYLAGCLARQGVRVAYFDWELEAGDHRHRLDLLFGAPTPAIRHVRCSQPAFYLADRLKREIETSGAQYAVFDSVAPACGGDPIDAELVTQYTATFRQLKVGSLHLAHITKGGGKIGDDNTQKPFGSVFWHNLMRSTWYVQRAADEMRADIARLGLHNRKANLRGLGRPFGLEFDFSSDRTRVARFDIGDSADLSQSLTVCERMKVRLRDGDLTLEALAEEINAKKGTIDQEIRRNKELFQHVMDYPDGITRIRLVRSE